MRGNTKWTVTPSNMLPDIHSRYKFLRADFTEHPWDLAYNVWHAKLSGYVNTIAIVFGVADVLYHLDASPARHDLVAIKDQINWRELWMPFHDVPDYLTGRRPTSMSSSASSFLASPPASSRTT